MANPAGVPKNSSDNEIWDLPFSFTVVAAGAVSAAAGQAPSLPKEIRSIAKTANAGEYLVTMREKWVEVVGFQAQGVSATVNRGQLTADAVASSPPTFTFVTLTETAGAQSAANLANPTKVFGTVSLRNSNVK
jgi:hypothetical protein